MRPGVERDQGTRQGTCRTSTAGHLGICSQHLLPSPRPRAGVPAGSHLSADGSANESKDMPIRGTREWARDHSARHFYPEMLLPPWLLCLKEVPAPQGQQRPVDKEHLSVTPLGLP